MENTVIEPKIDTFNIFVEDMKKTLDFYSLLGFTFKKGSENRTYNKITLNETKIAFYTKSSVDSFFDNKTNINTNGFPFSLSFSLMKEKNFDELIIKLNKEGHKVFYGPMKTEWGQKVVFFLDPDLNLIEINLKK